jgi:hypothetical protein
MQRFIKKVCQDGCTKLNSRKLIHKNSYKTYFHLDTFLSSFIFIQLKKYIHMLPPFMSFLHSRSFLTKIGGFDIKCH